MSLLPRRQWLRYSIRTLLVAVTISCVWLGWQVSIVRERKRLMDWAINDGGHVYHEPIANPYSTVIQARRIAIPWYRSLLGDKPVAVIGYANVWADEDEAERIKIQFPEADVTGGFGLVR